MVEPLRTEGIPGSSRLGTFTWPNNNAPAWVSAVSHWDCFLGPAPGRTWGWVLGTPLKWWEKKLVQEEWVFIYYVHELHCLENKVTVLITKVIPDAHSNTHTHTHTHSFGTGPRWLWYIWSPNNWGSGLTQSTLPAGATETRAFSVMGDKAAELFWWQAPLQGLWQAIAHGFAYCREPEEERKNVVGHKVTGHLALKHIWDPLYRLWELVE